MWVVLELLAVGRKPYMIVHIENKVSPWYRAEPNAMQYGEMPITYAELFNKVGIGSYPNFIIPHRKQNIRNIQPYQPPLQWKWYNA